MECAKNLVFKLLVAFPRGGHTPMPPGKPLETAPGRIEGSKFSCLTSEGQGTFCFAASPPPAASSPSMGLASRDKALWKGTRCAARPETLSPSETQMVPGSVFDFVTATD